MALLAIFLLVISSVLAVAALAVRFAGSNAVLAGVQPQTIADMAALNRWAGNRLLILFPGCAPNNSSKPKPLRGSA